MLLSVNQNIKELMPHQIKNKKHLTQRVSTDLEIPFSPLSRKGKPSYSELQ